MSLQDRLTDLRKRGAVVDLVILVAGGLLCLALTGYMRMNLHAPTQLIGDHVFTLGFAKSYIEGHGFRFNDQLGFPGVQDNLYFPTFDYSFRVLLWLEGHVIHNPFAAIHGMYIAGLLAMFGFAYWTLRRLGMRPWIAAIAAVSTVLTPFLGVRAYVHDFLALSFTAPLGLGVCLLIARSADNARLRDFLRDPYVIVAVLIAATSGLYYAFYTAMFVCLAGVATSIGQRRWFPVLTAMSIVGPLFIIMLAGGYGVDLPLALSSRFAGPVRYAFEQLVYGIEINSAAKALGFIPKVAAGQAAARAAVPAAFVNDLGEWPQPGLTLVILASPLLALLCFQAPETGDARPNLSRLIGVTALFVAFGLLFGINGGLGYFFNLIVTPQIRADERLMPFLTVGAVIILAAAAELSLRARPAVLRIGVPALIALELIAGWKPTLNALANAQRAALADPYSRQLQASLPAMLRAKDAIGAKAVLELPTAFWPEQAPLRGYDFYEHQLPFIFDRPGSGTRWSYGSNPRQPWHGLVVLISAEPGGMANRARALGFDSVLVVKRPYASGAVAALDKSLLSQIRLSCRLYDDQLYALYALVHDAQGRSC